jgi:hypothetical protein
MLGADGIPRGLKLLGQASDFLSDADADLLRT